MAWVARTGNRDMVKFFIFKGVLLNKEPITTMHQAIELTFSVLILGLFLKVVTAINAMDEKGLSPLSVAEEPGSPSVRSLT